MDPIEEYNAPNRSKASSFPHSKRTSKSSTSKSNQCESSGSSRSSSSVPSSKSSTCTPSSRSSTCTQSSSSVPSSRSSTCTQSSRSEDCTTGTESSQSSRSEDSSQSTDSSTCTESESTISTSCDKCHIPCKNYVLRLNGDDKLVQFGLLPDKNLIDVCDITDLNKLYDGICPQEFDTSICIQHCNDFKMSNLPNYINGNLIILNSDTAEDTVFSSLAQQHNEVNDIFNNLIGINGSLYILGTSHTKISGFNKLEYILGDLVIANNSNLILLPTFSSLLTVGQKQNDSATRSGRIIIANNLSLKKIVGFEVLKQVGSGIFVMDNANLRDICGFINLLRTNEIVITQNPLLSSIFGFCYIRIIQQNLYIACNNEKSNNNNMTIDAFHFLETVGTMSIKNNTKLVKLHFKKIAKINDGLYIIENNLLNEIDLSTLMFAGNIVIQNNNALTIMHFRTLQEINGELVIMNNSQLSSLGTFNNVKFINNGILIIGNDCLKSIKGLSLLEFVGSKVYHLDGPEPDNNQCLTNDWPAIFPPNCEDNGSGIFNYFVPVNTKIPHKFAHDICKVKFTNCSKWLVPDSNPVAMEQINVGIMIYNNQHLASIESFHLLGDIGGHIYIVKNICLDVICAFEKIDHLLDLYIRNNPMLRVIKGFNEVQTARDIIVTETIRLELFHGLRKLKHAQHLYLQSIHVDSIIGADRGNKLVAGLLLYHKKS